MDGHRSLHRPSSPSPHGVAAGRGGRPVTCYQFATGGSKWAYSGGLPVDGRWHSPPERNSVGRRAHAGNQNRLVLSGTTPSGELRTVLSSLGCPYSCGFCVDRNRPMSRFRPDRLHADLDFLSRHYPKLVIAYHDPNFAVRFDSTMDVMMRIPVHRRNPYVMESSLSILKAGTTSRLAETNCAVCRAGYRILDRLIQQIGHGITYRMPETRKGHRPT